MPIKFDHVNFDGCCLESASDRGKKLKTFKQRNFVLMESHTDTKLRYRYKNFKHTYKCLYKQFVRAKYQNSFIYRRYRIWRIDFKTWRYHQSWHKNLMRCRYRLSEQLYFLFHPSKSSPGTAEWLTSTEIKFGGKIWAVTVNKNPTDPTAGVDNMMVGGDRMLHQGYADYYSTFLKPYAQHRYNKFVICEVGILNGTGLAIWCDLFPNSRCIGLDIDLSNVERNFGNLKSLGAFRHVIPELFQYDQYVYSKEYLEEILGGDKIDIFIDDGAHSEASIMTTLNSVAPLLNDKFVYFVEDNWEVHSAIRTKYQLWTIYFEGGLTVIDSHPNQ